MARPLTSVTQLAELPVEDVESYFEREDAERIIGLVHYASDSELEALVALPQVREPAIRHVLARLDEFAIPERLATIKGVVQFHIAVPGGGVDRHAVRFDGTSVTVIDLDGQEPDVTIETDAVDFVRLVSGGANAALLFLADRLSLTGDEALALAVGGVFQVPGQPGVAVDPSAIDADDVAAAIKKVKDAHLRRVMSSGFRDVVIEQVFARFPDFIDERKAAKHTMSIGFTITGRADDDADRWTVHVADGTCRVERGGEGREATITLDGADFLKLVTGHLNPVMGVMRGHLKVRGDVPAALTLHKIMRVPGQR